MAVTSWAFGMMNLEPRFGYLGLINGLPALVLVGLSLLTFAAFVNWRSEKPSSILAIAQLFLLGIMLWGTVEPIAGSFNVEFDKLGRVDYILRTGHWNAVVDVYQNWPGLFILGAMINMAIGSEVISVATLKYVPLFSQFFMLLAFYMIVSKITKDPGRRWASCWLFLLGLNFIGFVPQMFGALLLFLCLWLILEISNGANQLNSVPYSIALIVLIAVLPSVHYLSALAVTLVLTVLCITRRLRIVPWLALDAMFVAGWTIFATYPYFRETLPSFVDHIFRVDVYVQGGLGGKLGAGAHRTVLLWQLAQAVCYVAFAGLGIWFARTRKWTKFDVSLLLAAVGPIVLGIALGAAYGIELGFRIFLFMLPPLAIFAAELVRQQRVAALGLLAFVVALGPSFFVNNYGVGQVGYTSPSYLSSLSFFTNKVDRGKALTFGQTFWGCVKNIESVGPAVDLTGRDVGGQMQRLALPAESDINEFILQQAVSQYPRYVPISGTDRALLSWKYGDAKLLDGIITSLDTGGLYDEIYVNNDSRIYINKLP